MAFSALRTRKKIPYIEDAAQAHGARWKGKRTGSFGKLGCFSFYPGKNLGAFGDAGLVTTDDLALYEKIRAIREYGSPKKYHHPEFGMNSRMDTMQALVLRKKLPLLEERNIRRYKVAQQYHEQLSGVGDLKLPDLPSEEEHVFHLFVIQSEKRDDLLKHLQDNDIGVGIHYPTPIHLHGAYADLGFSEGSFPIAEKSCSHMLSLPMCPELQKDQVAQVCTVLRRFFE